MIRWVTLLGVLMWVTTVWAGQSQVLRLSGPALAESLPLLAMAEPERPWPQGFEVEFIPWHSPDQLRAMIAGEQIDGGILTTAAASVLEHKGLKTRMVNLFEAPVWIVSATQGPDDLESLAGVLLIPFGPGEMPELLMRAAMTGPGPDMSWRHVGSPLEAIHRLLAGKAQHAILNEPAASLAVLRARALEEKGAPRLNKRIDLRLVWQKRFNGRLLNSGLAFFNQACQDQALLAAFSRTYAQACAWTVSHPKEALLLAQRRFPALASQAVDGRLPGVDIRLAHGRKAIEEAWFFLEKILKLSPAAIGGSMPSEDFFEIKP